MELQFQPASFGSVAAFVAIVAAVLVGFFCAVYCAYRTERPNEAGTRPVTKTIVSTAVWLGLLSALVGSGKMPALPLSGLPFFFGAVAVSGIAVGLSPLGGRIASSVPLKFLVLFQAFRLPLELVLHAWASQGTIPETMTWTGQNWDVVSGIVALVAFPFADRNRAIAWAVNLIGFALLMNVMRVALLSSPVPFGWDVTPPLQLALHLPYALIGPVCVAGALAGHIVLTRALLKKASPRPV